jgi:hypothetical protein
VYDNQHAFVCVDKDLKTVCMISYKRHIEMVLLMNEYAYVVLNHLLSKMIYHIHGNNGDFRIRNRNLYIDHLMYDYQTELKNK